MNQSILNSIKKLLGISPEDTSFDTDLIIHINTVFGILHQLGCGPETCYRISGNTEIWSSFLSDATDLDMVMSYVYMKVRKIFDPPTSGTLMQAIDETIKELEWRINVSVDPKLEVTT